MLSGDILGAALAILAALFLGSRIIVIRKATVEGNSSHAVMSSIWISVLFFLPAALFLHYPNFQITWTSLVSFVIAGLVGFSLGLAFYYEGTRKVGASRAVPITRGNMIVASVLAVIFLGEGVTGGHILGIVLLVLGVGLVNYEMEAGGGSNTLQSSRDLLFPIAAMLCFGLLAFFSKVGLGQGTPVTVGLSVSFVSALMGAGGMFMIRGKSPLAPFHTDQKYMYVAAAVFYSLSNICYYSALAVSRIVVTVPLRSISPLFVLALSYVFLRDLEDLTRLLVLGSVLVVSGAVMVGLFM
ncbi:hypothetical protein AKJ57_01025 [candidate division MSBL1 archaeon SCGC-AAA259A05]|uniref:EamA domain-containing protein n=1 Tax=candidate division MSBL1 archaeon SCGC-AAA259A05 TaxID=1698259 RepID=A0A133UBG5_9EURY|nr:hypothetical protein AKJ57_01025 [candidate division MSBL1 archaeon SCGC-AAA259A05]